MLIAAGICVVGAVVSQVLAPETMGRNLERNLGPTPRQAPREKYPA